MLETNNGWYAQARQLLTTFLNKKLRTICSLALVLVGLVVISFGVSRLYVNTTDVEVEEVDTQIAFCEKKPDFEQITVYISGAVENPGLYVLDVGSRRADAVELAGGLSSSADVVAVHKQINFATVLTDGENIYIPNKAEMETEIMKTIVTSANPTESSEKIGSPISINTSDAKTLEELDGVGGVRAQKIIENRPYQSLEELIQKNVLSESVYEKNKTKIIL